MKLLIAVINKQDSRRLHDALVGGGYRFTEIASTGGFLGRGNVTLLIGAADDQVEAAFALIRQHCAMREELVDVTPPDTRPYRRPGGETLTVPVGGAQVFVLNVEQALRV